MLGGLDVWCVKTLKSVCYGQKKRKYQLWELSTSFWAIRTRSVDWIRYPRTTCHLASSRVTRLLLWSNKQLQRKKEISRPFFYSLRPTKIVVLDLMACSAPSNCTLWKLQVLCKSHELYYNEIESFAAQHFTFTSSKTLKICHNHDNAHFYPLGQNEPMDRSESPTEWRSVARGKTWATMRFSRISEGFVPLLTDKGELELYHNIQILK